MKFSSAAGCFAVGLAALSVVGCRDSAATISASRLDASYTVPHHLLVFSDVGIVLKNKHDGDEEDILASEFVGALGKCGVTSSYLKKRPIDTQLTLDDTAKLKDDRGLSGNSFAADAILDIQWTRQTKSTGGPGTANYDLTLVDFKTRQPVWKAQMDFVSAWYGGQRFAATLVDRLKQDGLIPASCVTPIVPKA